MSEETNGWVEYKRRVLYQLEELTKSTEAIETKLDKMREEVVVLKTQAVIYSVVGGFIITIVMNLILKNF